VCSADSNSPAEEDSPQVVLCANLYRVLFHIRTYRVAKQFLMIRCLTLLPLFFIMAESCDPLGRLKETSLRERR
jgi:hypothetical protein